jgi:hypothetical protein
MILHASTVFLIHHSPFLLMLACKIVLTQVDLATVGYMIFCNGTLIEANSPVPTPVAMSSSKAELLGACCGSMAAAHIRMLANNMLYLGTPDWQEHVQTLPQTPTIIMIDDDATVQIIKCGRLTRKPVTLNVTSNL